MKKDISLYIHIPFCIKKCGYCDFVSFSGKEYIFEKYTDVLAMQIAEWEQKDRYKVNTIFLGGGTPSYLCCKLTEKIFDAIYKNYSVENNCEITIEVNPKTITAEKAAAYRKMGVNRISMGMQAKQDRLLKILGRIHNNDDFLNSYNIIRNAGIENVNFDIMTALPTQTEDELMETLEFAVSLNPTHISAYSLIIEEGTPFYDLYNEKSDLFPDDETDRKMYRNTVKYLKENGYDQYEISNFAKKNFECRHNITYWKCGEYKGFGLNSASYIENVRTTTTHNLDEYMKNPQMCQSEFIDKKSAMGEFMFLGLRMNDGINEKEFENKFGISVYNAYPKIIEKYILMGILKKTGHNISLTEKGIDVSNTVFCEFV